jgi:small GTP-binding protein
MYKIIKVVLCGAPGVGKTSLLKRLVNDPHDSYSESQRSTIGVDFKTVSIISKKSSNTIRFQIWDTAGQERFRSVSRTYFRGSHIFLFVYDVSKKESLERVREWLRDAEWEKNDKTGAYECVHTKQAIAFLVANKCDVPPERKQLSYAEGDAFAASYGMACFETSAKTGANVMGMFQAFADMMDEKVLEAMSKEQEEEDYELEKSVRVVENVQFLNKTQKGCC